MSQDKLFELGIYAPEVLDERIIVYLKCGGGVLLKYTKYVYVLKLIEDKSGWAINPYKFISVDLNLCKFGYCPTGIIYQNMYTTFMYINYEMLNKLEHAFNLNMFKNE